MPCQTGTRAPRFAEPKDYGHIGITMPDIDAAAARLAALGGAFVKRPNDGTIEGLPFVKNADGYWIEILRADALERPGRV